MVGSRKKTIKEAKAKENWKCYICHKEMRYDYLVKTHFPQQHHQKYSPPLASNQQSIKYAFTKASMPSASSPSRESETPQDSAGPFRNTDDEISPDRAGLQSLPDDPEPMEITIEGNILQLPPPVTSSVTSSSSNDAIIQRLQTLETQNRELKSMITDLNSAVTRSLQSNTKENVSSAKQSKHEEIAIAKLMVIITLLLFFIIFSCYLYSTLIVFQKCRSIGKYFYNECAILHTVV